MASYLAADVPAQHGRTFLLTGANSGIGFAAASLLAQRGARVLLGCRSAVRGGEAIYRIRQQYPAADVALVPLDLADLASVREAAAQVAREPALHVLVNNAGVMRPPRTLTRDGFEAQFGINHLGHFALTNLLLPQLAASASQQPARVVTVSSNAHKFGRIEFADLHARENYRPMARYAMSKLANLLFSFELQRRLQDRAMPVISAACLPGGANTGIARHFPRRLYRLMEPLARQVINSPAEGALPTLRAATDVHVRGGDYYGPSRLFETVHSAVPVAAHARALDERAAGRLWDVSVDLTGTTI